MMNSMSICTGFHAMNLKQHDGWTLDYDHRRACALPGLVVLHKYTHPAELTDAFANLTRINSAAIATTCRTFIIELQRRWRTDTLKPIFTEWARVFNNYEMLLTGYFVPVITMPKIQPTKKPISGKTNALGFPLQEREAVITVVVWFLSFFISFSIVSCHFWKQSVLPFILQGVPILVCIWHNFSRQTQFRCLQACGLTKRLNSSQLSALYF